MAGPVSRDPAAVAGPPAGRFITFEGIDGAGKSTHVDGFTERLRARGVSVVLTREPGGAPLAEKLRSLMLAEPMAPTTELLLAFAARAEHLAQTIEPALAAGQWVVSDRFTDSTYAYQGGGRGLAWQDIAMLEGLVQRGRQPDLTFYFDLSAEQAAMRRARARQADRFEAESLSFFTRVRAAYQRRVAEAPGRYVVVDAGRTVDEIKVLLEVEMKKLFFTGA